MNFNQSQIVTEYSFNRSGKPAYKIGGLTNFSCINIGETGKIYTFGAPYRRIKQEYHIEGYIIPHWSVVRNTKNRKYIIDPYFASRVISLYCHLKGVEYSVFRKRIKAIEGWELLWFLNEIKREIFYNKNQRGYDSYNVPVVSREYLNKIQDLLRQEFDLEAKIILTKSLKRLRLY